MSYRIGVAMPLDDNDELFILPHHGQIISLHQFAPFHP